MGRQTTSFRPISVSDTPSKNLGEAIPVLRSPTLPCAAKAMGQKSDSPAARDCLAIYELPELMTPSLDSPITVTLIRFQ
jgi:hypothetical protein